MSRSQANRGTDQSHAIATPSCDDWQQKAAIFFICLAIVEAVMYIATIVAVELGAKPSIRAYRTRLGMQKKKEKKGRKERMMKRLRKLKMRRLSQRRRLQRKEHRAKESFKRQHEREKRCDGFDESSHSENDEFNSPRNMRPSPTRTGKVAVKHPPISTHHDQPNASNHERHRSESQKRTNRKASHKNAAGTCIRPNRGLKIKTKSTQRSRSTPMKYKRTYGVDASPRENIYPTLPEALEERNSKPLYERKRYSATNEPVEMVTLRPKVNSHRGRLSKKAMKRFSETKYRSRDSASNMRKQQRILRADEEKADGFYQSRAINAERKQHSAQPSWKNHESSATTVDMVVIGPQ